MHEVSNKLTELLGIQHPIICGPMYPCSNPELIAATSNAGAIGIIQPISLTYVFGYEFRTGLQKIKSLTNKPVGMNALIEKSSRRYHQRMESWIDIALEEGIRFFITSMGKPNWVVDKVHAVGGLVFHDVTEKKWAIKAMEANVDGLIAVNNRAGGHAGTLDMLTLHKELVDFNLPIVCAGGVGSWDEYRRALNAGYAGVQMGTRFIASDECSAKPEYKNAIINASADDIVLSEKVTGVPVSLINTTYTKKQGIKLNAFTRSLLKLEKIKPVLRTWFALKSIYQLKQATINPENNHNYWQAGKSVSGITSIKPVNKIIEEFTSPRN